MPDKDNKISDPLSCSLSDNKKTTENDTTEGIPEPCAEAMFHWFREIHTRVEISEISKQCLQVS